MPANFIPDTPPPEYQSKENVNDDKCGLPTLNSEAALPLVHIEKVGASNIPVNISEYPLVDHGEQEECPPSPCRYEQKAEKAEKKYGRCASICIYTMKACILVALLYLFICSLDFLSSAFRLLGGKTAGSVFTHSELLSNPVTGLMIGILATILVQSSSTSTSVTVTMVASGILDVRTAIPIVMGANIGTSITNTLVSMGHAGDREQFRRAFAGATVHDMFNLASVLILLPLESFTGYLYNLTELILNNYEFSTTSAGDCEFLKKLTKPLTSRVVQLDKKVMEAIALGKEEYMHHSLIKSCKVYSSDVQQNVSAINNTGVYEMVTGTTTLATIPDCDVWSIIGELGLSDSSSGLVLLIGSLVMLCLCLYAMVRVLHSILQGQIAVVIERTMNSDLPGCLSYFTGYIALIVGAILTLLVQSSSVFTSALTPLVGLGVLRLERVYPLTLGSNVGTTGTGLLAAFTASGGRLRPALQISLCHLFFNLSGILMFYPIPKLRIPITLAKMLGDITADYRWFPMFYLLILFVVFPGFVFSLACVGPLAVTIGISILVLFITIIVIINVLQNKCPHRLPTCIQTWDWLPECLRSLKPLDRAITYMKNLILKVASSIRKPFQSCKSKHAPECVSQSERCLPDPSITIVIDGQIEQCFTKL